MTDNKDENIMKEAEEILQEVKDADAKDSAAEVKEDEKPEVKIVEQNLDYKDSLARLQAEFANFKTRSQKEQERARNWGKQSVIRELLPVLDEIGRARSHGELETDSPFGKIAQKFEDGLAKLGVTAFGAKGEEFDPLRHAALMNRDANDDDKIEDGQVLVDDVIEQGYELNGEIFQVAKVSTVTK
jgi:molecular chaperone GrpE